jgi:hypothetical protein
VLELTDPVNHGHVLVAGQLRPEGPGGIVVVEVKVLDANQAMISQLLLDDGTFVLQDGDQAADVSRWFGGQRSRQFSHHKFGSGVACSASVVIVANCAASILNDSSVSREKIYHVGAVPACSRSRQ